VQLIFILAVVLSQICLVNLIKFMEIVRAFRIDTLMDDEVFPVFLTGQRVGAIRALKGKGPGETVLIG
jgi:hypothetical protein